MFLDCSSLHTRRFSMRCSLFRAWFVVSLVSISLGFACEKPSQKKQDKTQNSKSSLSTAVSPTTQNREPQIHIEDAGSGTKKALRYRYQVGYTAIARMDMKMSMKMQIGSGPEEAVEMPTIGMKKKIHAQEVLSNGNLKYEFAIDAIDVGKDVALPESAINQLHGVFQGLVGTKGQVEVTSRGIMQKAEFQMPDNAHPLVTQMIDSLQQQIHQMSVPFPEEPVGVGARWTVTTQDEMGGISSTNIYHYTLEQMENDVVTMKLSAKQKAEPQNIKNPALPHGTTVKLTKLQSSESGHVVINLAQLVPQGEISATSTMNMHIQSGTQEQDMTQSMSIAIKLHPETP